MLTLRQTNRVEYQSFALSHCKYKAFFWCLSLCVFATTPFRNALAAPVSIEVAVEEALSPFLTHPKRRDPRERVVVIDGRAELWRYESFESGDVDQKLCESARSILFGRLAKSSGLKVLFRTQTQLRDLTLIHFRDQTSVQPSLTGHYVQSHKRQILARMSITREAALSVDLEDTKLKLMGPRCIESAKHLLSDLWVSEVILERREALRVASIKVNARRSERDDQQRLKAERN